MDISNDKEYDDAMDRLCQLLDIDAMYGMTWRQEEEYDEINYAMMDYDREEDCKDPEA